MNARVHVVSLGCSKNQVDTEVMLGRLCAAGVALSPQPAGADVLLVNTCALIKAARDEAAEVIAALVRGRNEARNLVVCGCLAELPAEDRGVQVEGVDAWVDIRGEQRIVEVLRQWMPALRAPRAHADRMLISPGHSAFLRIADGCNHTCAFCTIPRIRGPYRSVAPRALVAEARRLAGEGVVELNLVAQDTSAYGRDLIPHVPLAELVARLCTVGGIEWIRLQYLHPASVSNELLDVIATERKVCPYIDMPLQHIADRLLRQMKRPGRAFTMALLERIRSRVANVALAPFITGYPGERTEEFDELLGFIEHERFNHVGVFEYSRERGTVAHDAAGHVAARVKQARRAALMRAQQRVAFAHNIALVGTVAPVLIDAVAADGSARGRRRTDAPEVDDTVHVRPSAACVRGRILPVQFERAKPYDLFGACTKGEAA